MLRSRRAVPAFADPRHADRRRETRWIEFGGGRQPQQVAPARLKQRDIRRFLPWIGIEILIRAELKRVDEDRRYDV